MSELLLIGVAVVVVVLTALIFFSRLRLRTVALVGFGIIAVLVGAACLFSRALDQRFEARNGPLHVFEVSGNAPFLSEEIAIQKARAALAIEGYGSECQPVPDGRTSASDGRRDVYLARNTANPNAGWLVLTNASGKRFQIVVEVVGQKLTCRRVVLK